MRLVIKVGTSTLAHPSGKLNIRRVEKICKVLSDLKNAGNNVVLVSSGAIGMGMGKLNLASRPSDMSEKQAAAAVGQCELMYTYDKLFKDYNHTVAQILVTGDDIENVNRRNCFKDTVFKLIELGVIPVINENDTVSTQEISVGDNDTLAAIVAVNIKADLLILLSDIDGLYTADPNKDGKAELINEVNEINDKIYSLADGAVSKFGTGGMATKIKAAKICTDNRIDLVILNGDYPEFLYKAVAGERAGTRFIGKK